MRGNVGWKWKVGAYRLTIGCSTCKSSPQAAFDEWEHSLPLNPLECGSVHPKDLQDKTTPVSAVMEYTLAPWATKLPCTIEPLMNSDVEGYFTAKVNTNVYDTATGRHLLVPQGATIGGRDHGSTLLYGNERLPTTS